MTGPEQRAELQRRIWQIANDVRGAVDGWDFKQYVLGSLFYRFISENFASYIEAGDDSINYADLPDDVITPEIRDDAVKTKGYFIYPSQLFSNIVASANDNDSLNTDLADIFADIEASASGYPSEGDIKGLFADFDTTSNRLGNTVRDRNNRLTAVLRGVAELDFGEFQGNRIDLFGDAYEFLISNYAANAGKSGGEFFTPQHVSKLIAQLVMHKQTTVNRIYDPACGSGSLLLQAKKQFDNHIVEDGFFGQEINHTTYNLARMNMFLHNINYDRFNIQLGDTLIDPKFGDDKPFDAIVSNPPYSVKWIGSDDPTLINDDRFAPAGVLAPKSKADFAFVLHALSYLSSKGRAAIVCFPEPLAQLLRFGRPRPAFRFRQGPVTGSGGCPGRSHRSKCGGMSQLLASGTPSAHGWPRRPLRGGVRGVRRCLGRRCQMVSRISCSTVRASTPKKRWQATLACPRTRTCRAP